MKDSSYLRGHRIFRDLKPGELADLTELFSLFQCPPEACFIPEGSPVEGLYLIEKGRVREKGPEGKEQMYAAGDILGGDSLFCPCAASASFRALEECRILYLDRADYQLWKERRPRAVKRLKLPGQPSDSLKPAVLRENRLYWLVKTIPSLLFPPLLLIRLLLRKRNGAFIEGDRLVLRYFRWKSLKNTNLTIPLEQIQSVETIQKGLLSRLTKTGHLLIRVNGTGGHVLVKNIPHPQKEQERIVSLKRRTVEAAQARKHGKIRRDILSWIQKEEGLSVLERAVKEPKKTVPGATFRKSPFILLRLVWWQILLVGGCGALYFWGRLTKADWIFLPLFALGILILLIAYQLADWANDLYKVEGGMLLDLNRKPLGKSRSLRQAELTAIQNVIAEQKGLWANLFDFGDVKIIVPGSEEGILWEGLRSPGRVQERILRERRAWIDGKEEKERLAQQEDLMLYCRFISQELSEKNRS